MSKFAKTNTRKKKVHLMKQAAITKKPTAKLSKTTSTPTTLPVRIRNVRKEIVHIDAQLFDDSQAGKVWRQWADKHIPTAVFKHFGLTGPGSQSWQNVVEHNVFVAAASLTLAKHIQYSGYRIKTDRVLRAAIVHDATKRRDIEQAVSRENEGHDAALASYLLKHGFSYADIAVALNTGRNADRYITDKQQRAEAIAQHSVEANIVGYVDARTRGVHLYSLADSQRRNMASKLRAQDKVFFAKYWLPYYKAVEAHLRALDPEFDPRKLTDLAVYQTVLKQTKDYHRQ